MTTSTPPKKKSESKIRERFQLGFIRTCFECIRIRLYEQFLRLRFLIQDSPQQRRETLTNIQISDLIELFEEYLEDGIVQEMTSGDIQGQQAAQVLLILLSAHTITLLLSQTSGYAPQRTLGSLEEEGVEFDNQFFIFD